MAADKDTQWRDDGSSDPFAWEFRYAENERTGEISKYVAVAFQIDGRSDRPVRRVRSSRDEPNRPQGFLTAYVFASTKTGPIDLVGFHIENTGGWAFGEDRAKEIADREVNLSRRPTLGLTSREIRTAANQSGLLAKARLLLRERHADWALPGAEVRRTVRDDGKDDHFYASLAVEYAGVVAENPRGARKILSDRRGVADSTLKNWLTKATSRGFWWAAGPGRVGDATPKAFEMVNRRKP